MKESTIPDLSSGPVNIKWEKGAPASVNRDKHTAVLYNRVMYVGGGYTKDNDGYVQFPHTLDMYHTDANTWDTIDTPHISFAVTVLTGKVVIVGGYTTRDNKVTNKVLVLENGQWKDYTEMPTARYDVTAVSHHSMMTVMGGHVGSNTLSTTELFNDTTGQWFKCDDLPQPLSSAHSVIVGDTVFVLGGATKDNKYSTAVYAAPLDTLSSHQLKWQHLVDTPCGAPAAVGLNNKYLLAVGENDIYAQNSTATSWMTIGTLPVYTVGTTVVCDEQSQLVIIGGIVGDGRYTNKLWIGSFQ